MKFGLSDSLHIAVVAIIAVWLFNYALTKAGLSKFKA